MFESVKQYSPRDTARYFVSLLVSLVVHTAVICVIVAVPLVFCNSLPIDTILTFVMQTPTPPPPPPPPAPPVRSVAARKTIVSEGSVNLVPGTIPKGIKPVIDDTPAMIGLDKVVQGIGDSAPATRGMGPDVLSDLIKAPIIPPPPPPPPPKGPVRVHEGVQESKLIFRVDPVYPELARRAHISGTVMLEAIIDAEGNVTQLKTLSGHPFLVEAAAQAIKQWKYSPTVLNGEPIPVIAVVTIVFRFNR